MSINIWTDSMQHAALLGKPVLFTNWLIQRDIIPDGWYCYDLRGTHKSPSTRTTLVDHAADYHAGTVLSPIPLKHEGKQLQLEIEEHRLSFWVSRCFIFRRITMNRVLRIDEEKPEMHISVQGYKVTLCFAEKENPEVAVLVKQALLSAYAMPQK